MAEQYKNSKAFEEKVTKEYNEWLDVDKCKHDKTIYEECMDCHWNAAIEAAAKMADDKGMIGMKQLAENIRKLKK